MSEFHRLIEQQIPRLRRYARALTRNRERADDLVQDTLARALITSGAIALDIRCEAPFQLGCFHI
jgi:DNA-directed RNA polymerase specialized sigma24 family protein